VIVPESTPATASGVKYRPSRPGALYTRPTGYANAGTTTVDPLAQYSPENWDTCCGVGLPATRDSGAGSPAATSVTI
jgi:hypothetical protein